ncbi:MAG: VOC family protein [Hyphomicrobiaceae bacterium]|nr:VOC family protein [Hyphomicrobiaceae bacterium]
MEYLHTMIRIKNIDESLDFFCNKMSLVETHRIHNKNGRFTLIYLAAYPKEVKTRGLTAPLLELTYNWPDTEGKVEEYNSGRNFGHIAFGVDNIYETCQSLMDKGVTINRPPKDGNMAFIKSPDGISIEFLQKGTALKPSEPWISMKNTGTW